MEQGHQPGPQANSDLAKRVTLHARCAGGNAMVRIVHEQSERDLRIREVQQALADMAAQLMRLSAQAGSIWRFDQALKEFAKAMRELPSGPPLLEHEAQSALMFSRGVSSDEVDDELGNVLTQALRVVASRLERNDLQEQRSRGALLEAMERHQEACTRRAQRWREEYSLRRPLSIGERFALSLSHSMTAALLFIKESDGRRRREMKRPHNASLRALENRSLIRPGDGVLGYVLTEEGERVIEEASRPITEKDERP